VGGIFHRGQKRPVRVIRDGDMKTKVGRTTGTVDPMEKRQL